MALHPSVVAALIAQLNERTSTNNIALTDPATTDDESEGYEPFSLWLNTNTDRVFINVDNSLGAAIWIDITQSGGTGALPTPTQKGQVLFSVDGASFTIELPLTSPDGWLVNEAGLLIVVG